MARYSVEHNKQSKEAILASASRLFRLHGFEGVGIPEIAREAGLTHGTFYAHFDSKEDLYKEVVNSAGKARAERLKAATPATGPGRVRSIISYYLGAEHLQAVDRGCIMPGLGGELSRRPSRKGDPVRSQAEAYAEGLITELVACGQRKPRARQIAANLVGGLLMARLLDPEGRAGILDDLRRECLLLVEEK